MRVNNVFQNVISTIGVVGTAIVAAEAFAFGGQKFVDRSATFASNVNELISPTEYTVKVRGGLFPKYEKFTYNPFTNKRTIVNSEITSADKKSAIKGY